MSQATTPALARETPSIAPAVASAVALCLTLAVTLSGAGSQTVWYLVRVSGIVAYALLVLTLVAGLLTTGKVAPPGRWRVDLFQLHNFTALLVLGIGSFHALALLLDSYVGFSPVEVLVPFTSDYRNLAVSLGVLTLYLAGLLYASFWLRGIVGKKAWRVLHYTSFVAFVMATYHGIFTGSDSSTALMIGFYFASFLIVALLLMYRVIVATSEPVAPAEAALAPTLPLARSELPATTPELPPRAGEAHSTGGHLIAGVRR